MKKIMLCLMFLLLPVFVITGCSKGQITMLQIEETLNDMEFEEIFVENDSYTEYEFDCYHTSAASSLLNWQSNFERQNINTEKFMALDEYCLRVYYPDSSYPLHIECCFVFKFADVKSASNCYENYKFEEEFTSKQYGNLVVVADKNYADQIYSAIDNI